MRILLFLTFIMAGIISYAGQRWTQRADIPALARHRACGVSIGNKGYMGLGHYNGTGVETYFSDWWEYDPATNSWTQKADYIGNDHGGELGARTIGLDTVCFVGLGELDQYSFFKYSPATNTWTEVTGPPPGNTFRDTQDMVIGHKAYFTDLYHDELYEYDCSTDQWTLKGLLPFNWWFVFSGFTIGDKCYVKAFDQLWEYDTLTNAWSFNSFYPGYADIGSNCFVQHKKAYIVCGYEQTTTGNVTSEVWQFNPQETSWTYFGDFPGTSRRYSTQFTIGNRCYITTGTNGTNLKDLWEFNGLAETMEIEQKHVTTYPNPAIDEMNFSVDSKEKFRVDITDISGRILNSFEGSNGSAKMYRANLPAGTYMYRLVINGLVNTGRIQFQ